MGLFVYKNDFGNETINFADPKAVFQLNKAILFKEYALTSYKLPEGYLCPPIPGRADYLFYIAEMLEERFPKTNINGLDIGTGANCIYPIIGACQFGWQMVGVDIDKLAVKNAEEIISENKLKQNIEIKHQPNNANIFEGIINSKDFFHFTMCNPPFYSSEKEAQKNALKKLKNLNPTIKLTEAQRNFGGQANELWCNGGEALFIKRMIKQSVNHKSQVGLFTTLVSRKANLPKLYKQLDKLKAIHQTIEMSQGNKVSHILVWNF